jgi:hypothetical protein
MAHAGMAGIHLWERTSALTDTHQLRDGPRIRARVLDALPPFPIAVAFGVAVFLIVRQGGIDANASYEAALVLLGLALVATLSVRGRPTIARELWVALAGLAAYTAWSFASIAWSDAKGTAWDGANRTLLYLLVLALFALVPVPRRGADVLLVAYGTAIAAIGAYVFFTTTSSGNPLHAFVGGRFADPVGYANGNAALFMLGFWCVLPFVASTRVPGPVRLLCVVAAMVNLDLSLLAQSRGGIVAAALATLVYLAFVEDRVRGLGALAVCAAGAAIAAPDLFRVYRGATGTGVVSGVLRDARKEILVSAAVTILVTAAALGLARLARGRAVERLAVRAGRPALAGALAIAVVAGGATALVHRTYLADETRAKWHQFTATPAPGVLIQPGSSHFSSNLGGGARYDMWRVAWLEFRSKPLEGVGADNFAADYLRLRRSGEEPQYPHSSVVRLFSQTGIVGVLLFAVFVAGIALLLARGRRSRNGPVLAAAVAVSVYWLLHGAVDQLWEIPAVTGSALLVVGAALTVSSASDYRPRIPFVAGRGAVILAGALAAISLALPWFALREQAVALRTWRTRPAHAYHALDVARRANRLSDQPDILAGAIAAQRNDHPRMRRGFTLAIGRNSTNWYPYLELAALAALEHQNGVAARRLAEARRLNPSDPIIDQVQAGLKSGHPVSLAALDTIFLARFAAKTWPGRLRQPK